MEKLAEYWQKMSKWVLPFLKARKVAVELNFGEVSLYQRHPKDKKNEWLYIDTEEQVVEWADRHAWSFHPHLLGTDSWWFVVDVDGRGKDFDLGLSRDVSVKMAEEFDVLGYKYLVKYSGNRGFHFMWEWDMNGVNLKGKDRWDLVKSLILGFREGLEERLAKDPILSKKLVRAVGQGCPFTLTNSQEADCKRAILIDANIMHDNTNIRSPFSVHCKTGLVSVPLKGKADLMKFEKGIAERKAVTGRDWSWVRMPVNKWGDKD